MTISGVNAAVMPLNTSTTGGGAPMKPVQSLVQQVPTQVPGQVGQVPAPPTNALFGGGPTVPAAQPDLNSSISQLNTAIGNMSQLIGGGPAASTATAAPAGTQYVMVPASQVATTDPAAATAAATTAGGGPVASDQLAPVLQALQGVISTLTSLISQLQGQIGGGAAAGVAAGGGATAVDPNAALGGGLTATAQASTPALAAQPALPTADASATLGGGAPLTGVQQAPMKPVMQLGGPVQASATATSQVLQAPMKFGGLVQQAPMKQVQYLQFAPMKMHAPVQQPIRQSGPISIAINLSPKVQFTGGGFPVQQAPSKIPAIVQQAPQKLPTQVLPTTSTDIPQLVGGGSTDAGAVPSVPTTSTVPPGAVATV